MGKIKATLHRILFSKWLLYLLNKRKYKKKVLFDYSVTIGKNSKFEGMNKIYPNSSFEGIMGYGSYLGRNSHLAGKVGRYCSIGRNVKTNPGIHPYTAPYVSTSPVFYSLSKQNGGTFTEKQRFEEFRYANKEEKFPIMIGNDCWIGENVFIVGGVTVGDGAIILAGAAVTKDIPAYAIVGGVPAKIIKYRYDQDTINFLLSFEWWNKPAQWLIQHIELMNNIDQLKNIKL